VTRRRGLSDLRCAHCAGRYRDENWQWNRNEEPRLFGGKKWLAIGGHHTEKEYPMSNEDSGAVTGTKGTT